MKGLSPLISTVLLIAISLTIVSIIMGWATTLVREQTGAIGNRTGEAVECTGADIYIEDVYLNLRTNESRVHVRNSGQINLEIKSSSLSNDRGVMATNLTAFPVSIPKSDALKEVLFNITNIITACGNFSNAIVTTNCGNTYYKFTGTPNCVS
jgi:FlaG/FlaF family flagellin (archaellin)